MMALNAQEQQELDVLQKELATLQGIQPQQAQGQGLTAEEQQELQTLQQELAVLEQPSIDPRQEPSQVGRALRVGAESMGTLGTRPTIAGLGAGAGGFVGALETGKDIPEAFEEAIGAFKEARKEAIEEEKVLALKEPVASAAGQLIGGIVTAPLLPAKGIMGAVKAGAALGVGEAIGKAETLEEAATSVASGAVLGGAGGAALKVGGALTKKGVNLVKKLNIIEKK